MANYISQVTGSYSNKTLSQIGRYIMTSAPTETAIEISDVRTHLKITATTEDGYLGNLINVATEMIQNYTSQILMTQTQELHLPYFLNRIDINRCPVSRVNHIKYYDTNNVLQTLSDSNYNANVGLNDSLDQSPISTSIIPVKNFSYPETYPRMDAVQIRFEAGADGGPNVPMAIKQSMLLIIGQLYLNRTDMVYKMPVLSEYLLNPYRIATV